MANDAVRRIMAEVKEFTSLNAQPTSFFYAAPLESDLFEWHFTVRGPPDTPFEAGVYHGRILLPAEYPLKPPEIILLTPNGRFEVGKRICLSVTAHHQETWQPSWGVRTILTALVGFMPSKAEGVGALDYPDDDRRGLARKSHHFRCARCGARPIDQLPPRDVLAQLAAPSASTSDSTAPGAPPSQVDDRGTPTENGIEEGHQVHTREREPSRVTQVSQSAPRQGSAANPPHSTNGVASTANEPMSAPDRSSETLQSDNQQRLASSAPEPDAIEEDAIEPQHRTPTQPLVQASRSAQPQTEVLQTEREDGNASQAQPEVQEKELLYIAYAIVVLMLAVVARRVIKMLTE